MQKKFNKYKWGSLIAFSLLYNLVYLGRFNINNFMNELGNEIDITLFQENLIIGSVFISYAVGSFFNGYLADKYGSKKVIIIGSLVSISANIIVSFQYSWLLILSLWIINGYFQSMIWVGGISMLSQWWKREERGKGVGIANFFSGMSHATAYLIPLLLIFIRPDMEWRDSMILPMFAMLFFVIIYGIFGVDRPQNVGLMPYIENNKKGLAIERTLGKIRDRKGKPWKYFFSHKNFVWWCCIAMISSICRYGLLNWIPLYYMKYDENNMIDQTFLNLTLPIGMAFGTLIITWIAGTRFNKNLGIVVTAMAAICGTLVVVFPVIDSMTGVLTGIFFTGFALFGINGILWLYAIDQGRRVFSGSTAGILNAFAYLGAFFEVMISPFIIEHIGNTLMVFVFMEILCILMVIIGMIVSKKDVVVIPEVKE